MNSQFDKNRLRLRRQWAILLPGDNMPKDWQSYRFTTGEILAWHPDLNINIEEKDDDVLIILGILIDLKMPFGGNSSMLGKDLPEIENWLFTAAGNYVVIVSKDLNIKIYTDPGAMMGVYYKNGRASSSPVLLPDFKKDIEIEKEFPLVGTDDWYTGSLCPFIGIRSLIANHSLELKSGQIQRFWPKDVPNAVLPQDGIEGCGQLLRKIVGEVSKRGKLIVSLTGGKDSRVNLAAAKDVLGEIKFFTLRSSKTKRCDFDIPHALANKVFLNHEFIDVPPSEPWLVELYDEISGGIALGARRDILSACMKLSGADVIHLSGNLGAVAKAYYWRSARPVKLSTDILLRDFVNVAPCIKQGVNEWLGTLPSGLPASMIYNLMYLEQRGGRWMGVGENASSLFYQQFSAFNSRQLFELICAIPEEVQYRSDLHIEMINWLWPELLEVPFCASSRKFSLLLPKSLKDAIKKFIRR